MAQESWLGEALGTPPFSSSWYGYFQANLSATIILGLVVTLLVTRVISSTNNKSKTVNEDGVQTVPAVPYWLPLLGHLPNMAIDADGFVKGLRNVYSNGIFTLNFGGSRHNITYTPGLATALLNTKTSNADAEEVQAGIMEKIFGFPSKDVKDGTYSRGLPAVSACYKHILTEPSLGHMVDQTARKMQETVVNLVTFLESPVDITPWEKSSNIKLVERPNGEHVVEASLFPLIRDFCAFTANPTIMGTDFLENFPDFFSDIWTLDDGFLLLATGLPRWLPIPALTRAHIARKKNVDKLMIFHENLEKWSKGEDTGPKWSSLDDVGTLVKARLVEYQKLNWSIRARAATEHALMWAANANSNGLIFWIINRIYADRALLAMLREEVAPYIEVTQEKTDLPISEPPRISRVDVDGLCNKCPLLKSTYVESLRLDAASWSLKVVKQDFVLQSREKGSQPWLLRKGDYAHAAHDLHNTDPNYFDNPLEFKADRHIKYDEKKEGAVDLGSIRPYGGGTSMCKGRAFALKETLLFTASIISLWDIEAGGGGKWKMPKHRKATGVYSTNDDTRVWIKRRQLPT